MYDKIYSMSHALRGMPKNLGENLRTIIVSYFRNILHFQTQILFVC